MGNVSWTNQDKRFIRKYLLINSILYILYIKCLWFRFVNNSRVWIQLIMGFFFTYDYFTVYQINILNNTRLWKHLEIYGTSITGFTTIYHVECYNHRSFTSEIRDYRLAYWIFKSIEYLHEIYRRQPAQWKPSGHRL